MPERVCPGTAAPETASISGMSMRSPPARMRKPCDRLGSRPETAGWRPAPGAAMPPLMVGMMVRDKDRDEPQPLPLSSTAATGAASPGSTTTSAVAATQQPDSCHGTPVSRLRRDRQNDG